MNKGFGVAWVATAALATTGQAAQAGEKPLVGPAPSWVVPAPEIVPGAAAASTNTVQRFDEQVFVQGDQATSYLDSAVYVGSTEMLAQLGTVTVPWQPGHGDLTFVKVEILRGKERIDALKDGSGVTVLRREAGLERLMVDGTLTAVLHVEGLRVGDVLHMVVFATNRDTLLGGQVQGQMLLLPKPMRTGFGRARLVWPADRKLAWKALMPGITAQPVAIPGGLQELTIPLPVEKLPEMADDAPERFRALPIVTVSSFTGWDQVSSVMAPLYRTEGTIAEGSDLAKQVDAIAARSKDPVQRMAEALTLVQDDVRYQLIALGSGNYKPQTPAETWAKRYGDCKAKTMLLLAILQRLGIEAEPVLANIARGDAVNDMLPAALAFDHVFVHARSGGEDFWLDGTNLGSRLPDIRDVPRFGYVLPVREKGAGLIALPRRADARPGIDVTVDYDQSAGPYLPVPYTLTARYSGPYQERQRVDEDGTEDDKLGTFAGQIAQRWTDSAVVGKPVAKYDRANATWVVTVEGVAFPDWNFREGRYQTSVPAELGVSFDPDRAKSAWRQIPALISQPWSAAYHAVRQLPGGGRGIDADGLQPASLNLPAVAWQRSTALAGGRLSDEIISRETGAEVPADQVSATARTISEATGKPVIIRLPADYPMRWVDVPRQRASAPVKRVLAVYDQRIALKPDDAERRDNRAWFNEQLLDFPAAEADYTKALAIDATAARYLKREAVRSYMGNYAGALADAQAAYDLASGDKKARSALALELARVGKTDDAVALLNADPDLSSDDGLEEVNAKAEVLDLGGRHDDALALLGTALQKRPNAALLLNGRCWLNGLRNTNLDAALSDCNRAIELSADAPGYLDSRALIHFRAGRFAEAKKDLDAALALSPDLAPSLYLRGMALLRLGQKAAGEADIAAARRLYPGIDKERAPYGLVP